MKFRQSWITAIAVVLFSTVPALEAWAVVDNSQPPSPLLCTGACGVGSSFGAVRQIVQINDEDTTGTSFSDIWTFTLSEPARMSGGLFANNSLDPFRLLNLNIILQSGDGTITFDPIAGYTVPNPPPANMVLQTALNFSNLAAGDYRFVISGLVPDSHDAGQYQLQGTVSEVPLPAAVWFLLSALGGLLGIARVRQRRPEAA